MAPSRATKPSAVTVRIRERVEELFMD